MRKKGLDLLYRLYYQICYIIWIYNYICFIFVSLISGFAIVGSGNENKACHVPLNKCWLWVPDSADWSSGKMAAYFIIHKPLANITFQPVQCHSHCIMNATSCTITHQVISPTLSSWGILLIHFQNEEDVFMFCKQLLLLKRKITLRRKFGNYSWLELLSSGCYNVRVYR
jgi:hypothetical protein